jgi:hypothetical protein
MRVEVRDSFKLTDSARAMLMSVFAAVTPDEAAQSLASFIDTFDISNTGEFWAPRGPGYVTSHLSYGLYYLTP